MHKNKLGPIVKSSAMLLLFLCFLVGSRSPISPLGIDIPQPREIFWAIIAFLVAVFVWSFSGTKMTLSLKMTKLNIYLIFFPISFLVVLFVSGLFQQNNLTDISQSFALLILSVAVIIVSFQTRPKELLFFWFSLTFVFTAFFILALWIGPQGPEGHFTALSIGRISFGQYMGIGAITAWYLGFNFRFRLFIPISFVLIIATALSGARGAIVALFISAIITFIFCTYRWWFAFFFSLTTFLIVFFSFGPWKIPILESRYSKTSPLDSSKRDVIWSEKIQSFTNPSSNISSNVGVNISGPTKPESLNVDLSVQQMKAHNLFLETLLRSGWFGLALLILVLSISAVFLTRVIRNNTDIGLPAVLTSFVLITAQLSGTIYENSLIWFFFFIAVTQTIDTDTTKSIHITKLEFLKRGKRFATPDGQVDSDNKIPILMTVALTICSISLIIIGNSW